MPILLGGSGRKKKKVKTEQREAGVKATGRKERGLIWRQVDMGEPQTRYPSEPQTVDQRQAHVLPFPEEARARAVWQLLSIVLEWSTFQSVGLFSQKYPTSREDKVYSCRISGKVL